MSDCFDTIPQSVVLDTSPPGIQREVEHYLDRIAAITQEIEARRLLNKRGDLSDDEFRSWMRRAMAARSEFRGQVSALRNAIEAQRHAERKSRRGPARLPKGHKPPEMEAPPPKWVEPETLIEATERRKALLVRVAEFQNAVERGEHRSGGRAFHALLVEIAWINRWIKARNADMSASVHGSPTKMLAGMLELVNRLMDCGTMLTEDEHALCDLVAARLEWIEAERVRLNAAVEMIHTEEARP